MQSFAKVVRQAADLLALKLLALVTMRIAHSFWARAQMFMHAGVSIPEVSLRRGAGSVALRYCRPCEHVSATKCE